MLVFFTLENVAGLGKIHCTVCVHVLIFGQPKFLSIYTSEKSSWSDLKSLADFSLNCDLFTRTGLEIATHWSPMRPKLEHWRLNFQNWSPAVTHRVLSDN